MIADKSIDYALVRKQFCSFSLKLNVQFLFKWKKCQQRMRVSFLILLAYLPNLVFYWAEKIVLIYLSV